MIYSNACSYAIRALTRMALLRPDSYILMTELCADSDLPRHFVAKIFQELVRKGLLLSAKGRGGGFALAKPAGEIKLFDIVAIVDGSDQFDQCVVGMAKCSDTEPCPLHDHFKAIRVNIKIFLTDTTLADMATTLSKKLDILEINLQEPQSKSKPVVM